MLKTTRTASGLVLLLVLLGEGCDTRRAQGPDEAEEPASSGFGDPRLPGLESVDGALEARLARAFRARGPGYAPRTRHRRNDGSPRFTNRLIEESSPYLLQHAHNPVSWYPWSAAAFERAERENKPIFLSIGYSTCHWCHVMERESFEDVEIAAFLNRHFISIKVDREQRPDIDSAYMTAVNLLSGRGGWPMTLLLTPDKQPFFAGTYFPPRAGTRGARVGLIDILTQMLALYRNEPAAVVARARDVSQSVKRASFVAAGPGVPSDRLIVNAVYDLAARYDPVEGGFGGAPKFPQPSRLALLMRYARRTQDPGATRMVTRTLDRMAAGGIYDHVGGGFHRYATDARWRVPHFEKMLYDNAQLATVYLEAWQHTGEAEYLRIVREILDYVETEMTAEQGVFYSATDADSLAPSGNEEEGWYFTWTRPELVAALGPRDAALVASAFGVTEPGFFEGRNVLYRHKSDPELARELGVSRARIAERLASARVALQRARSSRSPPHLDDKIIAAWNGLMISAFARAGWALGDQDYVNAASRAAERVLKRMRNERGELVRTYRDGDKSEASFLDDHAFLVQSLLDLYEATSSAIWLERALALQAAQDARFADPQNGGYYLSPSDVEAVLVRQKPVHDGALPSGNAVSAINLLRLWDLTGEQRWRERAESLFKSLGASLARAPSAAPMLLVALDHYYDVPHEVAIVVSESAAEGDALARRARETFAPNNVTLLLREREAERQVARVPWLEGKRAIEGKPTAYVCERGRCELPTHDPAVFASQLEARAPYPSFIDAPPARLGVTAGPQ